MSDLVDTKKPVDYTRLLVEFGTSPITPELLVRLERLAKRPLPPILKRGLFFSHRSLNELLDILEQPQPSDPSFYLYTGRGPSSSSLHLGHLIPFMLTKYLSETFDVPVVIQMTDDEKFLFRDLTQEQIREMTLNNVRDIIAVGFDPRKTFIFSNLAYIAELYPNVLTISKALTCNQIRAAFGLVGTDNIGKYAFPPVQIAPAFASSFPKVLPGRKGPVLPCVIPCAIDQDPFFRLTRDIAHRVVPGPYDDTSSSLRGKPVVIHSRYFPSLLGPGTKMSSSEPASAIFLDDTPDQLRKKVNSVFTGGRTTLEEHRRLGADLTVDVPFAYLQVFLEDDQQLAEIETEYGAGRMLTRDIKKILFDTLAPILENHQKRRAAVTDEVVASFMTIHPIV